MSVYYVLWSDPAATPLDYSDDVQVVSSGDLFANIAAADKSGPNRASSSWPASMADCTNDPYHDDWWTLATVTTPGTYRLQVTTTNALNPSDQLGVSAENMWGLRAIPTNAVYRPNVYGLGKMVIYANVAAGVTEFYLGQIQAVHAGKTMVIQLFDPGDASGTSQIEILKPTTTNYTAATFSYTADPSAAGSKKGTNVTSLQTTISGAAQYKNSWVTSRCPYPRRTTHPIRPPSPPRSGAAGGRSDTRSPLPPATPPPGWSRSAATPCTSSSPDLPSQVGMATPDQASGPGWYFRSVGGDGGAG